VGAYPSSKRAGPLAWMQKWLRGHYVQAKTSNTVREQDDRMRSGLDLAVQIFGRARHFVFDALKVFNVNCAQFLNLSRSSIEGNMFKTPRLGTEITPVMGSRQKSARRPAAFLFDFSSSASCQSWSLDRGRYWSNSGVEGCLAIGKWPSSLRVRTGRQRSVPVPSPGPDQGDFA
jgi:hypothetical protein